MRFEDQCVKYTNFVRLGDMPLFKLILGAGAPMAMKSVLSQKERGTGVQFNSTDAPLPERTIKRRTGLKKQLIEKRMEV